MQPRLVRVSLRFTPAGKLSFAEIQERVVAAINDEPAIWASAWDRTIDELQAQIRSTQTFPDLFAPFGPAAR